MHKYTSNKSHRKLIITIITIVSLIVNLALTPLCDFIVTKLSTYLGTSYIAFTLIIGLGFSTIFGALHFIFDRWLWKIIPSINRQKISGVFSCDGISSYKNQDWHADIIIKQTWSKILITFKTDNSYSQSYMAHIDVLDDGNVKLYYSYRNDPNGNLKTLHKHEGTAIITFYGTSIDGMYYNNQIDRNRYGTFKLKRRGGHK